MKINQHTKISELIKANEASIEAIASIATTFNKLKNPLLRKVMAPRVNIAQAAFIAKCSVSDFKRVLEPLGFIFQDDIETADIQQTEKQPQPQWLNDIDDARKTYFDVRGIINSGSDPLKEILQKYGALPAKHLLCVINSFIPYPLISLLENKGAKSFVQTLDENICYTWFLKEKELANEAVQSGNIITHHEASFNKLIASYNDNELKKIDVRQLPMPLPMQTILETLAYLPSNQVLYVQHKRVPVHLLEELDGQAYKIHLYEAGEGDVKMMIIQN